MRKKLFCLMMLLCCAGGAQVMAQTFVYRMDATTNGTTVNMDGPLWIRDDDSQGAGAPEAGSPQRGVDYTLSVNGMCAGESRLGLRIDSLSISCLDTLYVYDGLTATGTPIAKINSFTNNYSAGDILYISPSNTTGALTVRFKTDPLTDTSRTHKSCFTQFGVGKGFQLTVICDKPCEKVVPVIDNKFYRTTRDGEIYDSSYVKFITVYDTNYYVEDDPTSGIDYIDTFEFYGANLCIGDGVIFTGHGDYSYKYGYYTPSDATTYFRWDMANGGDTIAGIGATKAEYYDYQRTGCFDIRLDLVDAFGCKNSVIASIKARTALNPIKTIFSLGDVCNSDSIMVNMGYGDGATLSLRKIENEEAISKINEVRTFIPDGCECATPSYFEAPVEFTEFPNSRYVESARDICSICVNMEHSFLGDFYLTVVCPTNQEAILKYGNPNNCPPQNNAVPEQGAGGGENGSGVFLGFPLDTQPGTWDGSGSGPTSTKCDSTYNPYGIGLDYCFSRDTHYTLITGENAAAVWSPSNPNPQGNFYIVSPGNTATYPVTFPAVGPQFAQSGQVPEPAGGQMTTKIPSDHEGKTNYYLPYTSFSELVGCPLNGLWKMRVYDTWGIDNGWIFNWSLDICNVMPDDCKYQVGIDSVVWVPDPDPQYHDYDLGHYRGLEINAASPTISHISSPDTAGDFRVLVKVYDEFGCVWDTATAITTYWTPIPNLGPDTSLCGVDRMLLDASDRHNDSTNHFSYIWSPFGQNTDTITTAEGATGDIDYVVRAFSRPAEGLSCEARDTIRVGIRRQPMPNFVPIPFTFEGCAPFTLSFDNRSVDAVEHYWVFGDGITSTQPSPTHTYDAGLYDLKYYATSADGCVDSIISPQAIAVFDAPKAGFSWSPTYPSVLNPVATFTNLTEPKTAWTKYFWEVQYNIDYPLSVQTLTDETPSFDFSQYTEGDPSGNYAVRLIARTDNLAPSGNIIYCRDTTENTILVVNDFLQFPNVVSPNDDGINDRFVIVNLVNGMGYPINQLDIYNKWGTRVFHKENISRDEDFWDPKDMPAGTYFYRFSAKGYNGNIEHNGAIEVVK